MAHRAGRAGFAHEVSQRNSLKEKG